MEHGPENTEAAAPLCVNGVQIDDAAIAGERAQYEGEPDPERGARCALVIRELLRQRAVALGMLDEHAPLDDAAVDALFARELNVPQSTHADCERYYRQHPAVSGVTTSCTQATSCSR